MVLRLDAAAGELRVTTPRGVSDARVARFIDAQRGWIAERLATAPPPAPFADGAVIPYRGRLTTLRHAPNAGRRVVWAENEAEIRAGGEAAHFPARIAEWLKAEARRDLSDRARRYAAALDRRVARIRIADPRSRWGSCSTTGTLSFSWRLILAPDAVRDYVAAHEAAHLVEMNHSAAFWATLRSICPAMDAAQSWLKTDGGDLRRYGAGAD